MSVREDEAPAEPVEAERWRPTRRRRGPAAAVPHPDAPSSSCRRRRSSPSRKAEAEEDDGIKPLSERLVTELTAHRTLALRDALANDPDTAFVAVLHALCLGAFYRMSSATCLEISAKSTSFSAQAPGLADSASAKAIEARHQQWAKQLPKAEDDLWDALVAFDATARRRCSRIALRSASTPCMSRGTAARGASPTPTRWRAR